MQLTPERVVQDSVYVLQKLIKLYLLSIELHQPLNFQHNPKIIFNSCDNIQDTSVFLENILDLISILKILQESKPATIKKKRKFLSRQITSDQQEYNIRTYNIF